MPRSNLLLIFSLLTSRPAVAATCYETAPKTSPHLTLSWSERPGEISQLALQRGGRTFTTAVSCTFSQPFQCRLDGDLGRFTLTPDQTARVTLSVKNGRLSLKTDDGGELQVARVPGAPTPYTLEPRAPATCAARFGADQPHLEFP